MWGIGILGFRIALERRRQRMEQAAALAALERGFDGFHYGNPHPEAGNAF
jgi:hypothetical protein